MAVVRAVAAYDGTWLDGYPAPPRQRSSLAILLMPSVARAEQIMETQDAHSWVSRREVAQQRRAHRQRVDCTAGRASARLRWLGSKLWEKVAQLPVSSESAR